MGERKIEYEFEDLRRNDDELPPAVLAQLGEVVSDDDDDNDVIAANDDNDDNDDGDEKLVPISEVNKRISRVRTEADRKVKAAKEEAAEVIGDLQKRVTTIEKGGEEEKLTEEYEGKVATLNGQIDEAVEEGDSKKVSQLTAQLSELTAENVVKREALKRKQDEHDEPDDLNAEAKPRVIARAKDWLAEQEWWDDPEHAAVKRYVNRLDRALQEKGYDPNDDDFYIQLEEAVEKKHPGIIVRTMDDLDLDDDADDEFSDIPSKTQSRKKRQRRAAGKSPTGDKTEQTGNNAARKRGGKKSKTLNRNQIANMRMFGMDPNNKEHVEAYLAEVQ